MHASFAHSRSLPWLSCVLLLPCALSMAVHAQTCGGSLAFISDTQAPLWIETLWQRPDHNTQATAALFADLDARSATDVFITGDVVNMGPAGSHWTAMDTLLTRTRNRGKQVHGLLGNHELMRNARKGERNFQQRFPEHVNTGYVVHVDSIAVLLLNSNFKKMDRVQRAEQRAWYTRTLMALDTAAAVRAIIVCCHHSPYSDSRIVGSNTDVQNEFVQPFLQAHRTALFISGHAHLFEHFQLQGKQFFVIGGGGGLHHPFRSTPVDLPGLVNVDADYRPNYHYLMVDRCGDRLVVRSLRTNDTVDSVHEGRHFEFSIGPR